MGHGALIDPCAVCHMAAVDKLPAENRSAGAHRKHVGSADGLAYISIPHHSAGQGGAGGVSAPNELSCPGANGVVFLPYMMGERSPVWDPKARGVFFGLSLNSTRDDLVRAVLESSGYGLRQMMALAQEITGHKITAFSAIGGGSRSDISRSVNTSKGSVSIP